MTLLHLQKILERTPLADYPKSSRIHRLNSFDTETCTSFVKREDELGFGISGFKVRKYLSLVPYLISQNFKEVIVLGTPFSNHVLSISQVLRENKIAPILFLKGEKQEPLHGNFLLTSLIVRSDEVHWLSKKCDCEAVISSYIQEKERLGFRVGYIPEGGTCTQALPGALTLAMDILANEKNQQIEFDHIFIDAGTGMMAASLILGFSYLKKAAHIHAVVMAGDLNDFEACLLRRKAEFEELIQVSLGSHLNYTTYLPENAASFGSVNSTVLKTVYEIAQEEGILTDPIYSAKLFFEGKNILRKKRLSGKALFIHSGGGLSLCGFQELLAKTIKRL